MVRQGDSFTLGVVLFVRHGGVSYGLLYACQRLNSRPAKKKSDISFTFYRILLLKGSNLLAEHLVRAHILEVFSDVVVDEDTLDKAIQSYTEQDNLANRDDQGHNIQGVGVQD